MEEEFLWTKVKKETDISPIEKKNKNQQEQNWNCLRWICYYCIKEFKGFVQLKTHQEAFHNISNEVDLKFECFDCRELVLGYSSFLNHIRRDHYKALRLCCDVCNAVLSDYQQLSSHRDKHSDLIHPVVYHCTSCEEVRSTEQSLKLHIQHSHNLIPMGKISSNIQLSSQRNGDYRNESSQHLTDASVVGQSIKCEDKDEYCETEETFQCFQCVRNFLTEADLTNHKKIHDIKSYIKCDPSPRKFKAKLNLMNHSEIHTTEEVLKCDICLKEFKRKQHLEKHLKTHSDERPFKCDTCFKSFKWKSDLKIHLSIHNNERPYKCDVCSKQFTLKPILKKHLKTHTAGRPLKCDICSKGFRFKSDLEIHLRIHSKEKPFKCNICLKSFSIKSSLTDHVKLHNNDRPFKCEICLKTFIKKSKLTIHSRTHTNERPFKCNICPKKFTSKTVLKAHMKAHDVL